MYGFIKFSGWNGSPSSGLSRINKDSVDLLEHFFIKPLKYLSLHSFYFFNKRKNMSWVDFHKIIQMKIATHFFWNTLTIHDFGSKLTIWIWNNIFYKYNQNCIKFSSIALQAQNAFSKKNNPTSKFPAKITPKDYIKLCTEPFHKMRIVKTQFPFMELKIAWLMFGWSCLTLNESWLWKWEDFRFSLINIKHQCVKSLCRQNLKFLISL